MMRLKKIPTIRTFTMLTMLCFVCAQSFAATPFEKVVAAKNLSKTPAASPEETALAQEKAKTLIDNKNLFIDPVASDKVNLGVQVELNKAGYIKTIIFEDGYKFDVTYTVTVDGKIRQIILSHGNAKIKIKAAASPAQLPSIPAATPNLQVAKAPKAPGASVMVVQASFGTGEDAMDADKFVGPLPTEVYRKIDEFNDVRADKDADKIPTDQTITLPQEIFDPLLKDFKLPSKYSRLNKTTLGFEDSKKLKSSQTTAAFGINFKALRQAFETLETSQSKALLTYQLTKNNGNLKEDLSTSSLQDKEFIQGTVTAKPYMNHSNATISATTQIIDRTSNAQDKAVQEIRKELMGQTSATDKLSPAKATDLPRQQALEQSLEKSAATFKDSLQEIFSGQTQVQVNGSVTEIVIYLEQNN